MQLVDRETQGSFASSSRKRRRSESPPSLGNQPSWKHRDQLQYPLFELHSPPPSHLFNSHEMSVPPALETVLIDTDSNSKDDDDAKLLIPILEALGARTQATSSGSNPTASQEVQDSWAEIDAILSQNIRSYGPPPADTPVPTVFGVDCLHSSRCEERFERLERRLEVQEDTTSCVKRYLKWQHKAHANQRKADESLMDLMLGVSGLGDSDDSDTGYSAVASIQGKGKVRG